MREPRAATREALLVEGVFNLFLRAFDSFKEVDLYVDVHITRLQLASLFRCFVELEKLLEVFDNFIVRLEAFILAVGASTEAERSKWVPAEAASHLLVVVLLI